MFDEDFSGEPLRALRCRAFSAAAASSSVLLRASGGVGGGAESTRAGGAGAGAATTSDRGAASAGASPTRGDSSSEASSSVAGVAESFRPGANVTVRSRTSSKSFEVSTFIIDPDREGSPYADHSDFADERAVLADDVCSLRRPAEETEPMLLYGPMWLLSGPEKVERLGPVNSPSSSTVGGAGERCSMLNCTRGVCGFGESPCAEAMSDLPVLIGGGCVRVGGSFVAEPFGERVLGDSPLLDSAPIILGGSPQNTAMSAARGGSQKQATK